MTPGTGPGRGEWTSEERAALLELARASLEGAVLRQRPGRSVPPSERLSQPRGAFVTLTLGGELRGCIGYIRAVKPLWTAVAEMAVQAGLHDPRFMPVTQAELPSLEYEISVLTPMERVEQPEQIEVGRDGLMIVKGMYSGLLLPQVATEYGWDRETFLEQTCLKAGLSPQAWRQGADIYRFSATVFSERSERLEPAGPKDD